MDKRPVIEKGDVCEITWAGYPRDSGKRVLTTRRVIITHVNEQQDCTNFQYKPAVTLGEERFCTFGQAVLYKSPKHLPEGVLSVRLIQRG